MGIFSKKYDDNTLRNQHFDELRKLIELIGTKVAILESRLEGVSANVASLRNRFNRSYRESDEIETSDIEDEAKEIKTENINNPVLLPEDGIIRKSRKHR